MGITPALVLIPDKPQTKTFPATVAVKLLAFWTHCAGFSKELIKADERQQNLEEEEDVDSLEDDSDEEGTVGTSGRTKSSLYHINEDRKVSSFLVVFLNVLVLS